MKTQACIWLSPEDRATLEGWVADRNTAAEVGLAIADCAVVG
jgi:hypothetical protein